MKVTNLIGANGQNGITVYKSINMKVFQTIKGMIDNDVYSIRFIIKNFSKLSVDMYIIDREFREFSITKINYDNKVFKYKIETTYGDDDSSDSIDFILPPKLHNRDKFKMRMFDALGAVNTTVNPLTKLSAWSIL